MKIKSQFSRTLVAIAAAVAMSSVAVGAAVGPAQAAGGSSSVITLAKVPTYA